MMEQLKNATGVDLERMANRADGNAGGDVPRELS
jgi:hypothetical protein